MKILAVGDMHLGRTPSRLPQELSGQARELGPAGAWQRTVDVAIAHRVRAVLLVGDVVERENDFFEAYRQLEQGVQRLSEAGVEVIGVVGNHDVKVLPRLAEQLPEFRLLGKQGEWESCQIADAADSITLWGWSFPRREVQDSPLSGATFARGEGINLGLLHCDRDAGNSPYAPVTSQELRQAGLDGWLLGHIHKPDALSAEAPNGYLGSLVGLDRSETGRMVPGLSRLPAGGLRVLNNCHWRRCAGILWMLNWKVLEGRSRQKIACRRGYASLTNSSQPRNQRAGRGRSASQVHRAHPFRRGCH